MTVNSYFKSTKQFSKEVPVKTHLKNIKFLVLLTDWNLLVKPITSSLSFLCFIKALRQLWGCLRGQFLIERWSKWKDEEQWSWQVCTQGRSCGDCCRTNMMSRPITVKPPQYDRLILKALFSCGRAAQQHWYFFPKVFWDIISFGDFLCAAGGTAVWRRSGRLRPSEEKIKRGTDPTTCRGTSRQEVVKCLQWNSSKPG